MSPTVETADERAQRVGGAIAEQRSVDLVAEFRGCYADGAAAESDRQSARRARPTEIRSPVLREHGRPQRPRIA